MKFGSTIATLSDSIPMVFGDGQWMTFDIGEAEYVGEGANKASSVISADHQDGQAVQIPQDGAVD